MAQTQRKLEEKNRQISAWNPFFAEQFTVNSGTSTIVNNGMSTLTPSTGFALDYFGFVGATGAAFAAAPTATPTSEQAQQYPRHILRKLEKLAAAPLDDAAPDGEREFTDWLHSD